MKNRLHRVIVRIATSMHSVMVKISLHQKQAFGGLIQQAKTLLNVSILKPVLEETKMQQLEDV